MENLMPKEITQDRWQSILEAMPPIYISEVDGKNVSKGIAMSEPYSHTSKAVVLIVCYQQDGKFYEVLAEIYRPDGHAVWETFNHIGKRDYIAKLVKPS